MSIFKKVVSITIFPLLLVANDSKELEKNIAGCKAGDGKSCMKSGFAYEDGDGVTKSIR